MTAKTLFSIGLGGLMLTSVASAKNKKSFEELDTNNDGKLSEAEFIAGAKKPEKAKKKFKKRDKNGDGFLSPEEFSRKKKGKGKKKKDKNKA